MARVTIEDIQVKNRFLLVLLAVQRVKSLTSNLSASNTSTNKQEDEKKKKKEKITVISLRDLAAASDKKIEEIKNELRRSWQIQNKVTKFEEEPLITDPEIEANDGENFDYELDNSDFYSIPPESDDLVFGLANDIPTGDKGKL